MMCLAGSRFLYRNILNTNSLVNHNHFMEFFGLLSGFLKLELYCYNHMRNYDLGVSINSTNVNWF
jgi:hypothetical protein